MEVHQISSNVGEILLLYQNGLIKNPDRVMSNNKNETYLKIT